MSDSLSLRKEFTRLTLEARAHGDNPGQALEIMLDALEALGLAVVGELESIKNSVQALEEKSWTDAQGS